jgi:hypothetical protein
MVDLLVVPADNRHGEHKPAVPADADRQPTGSV